ncbi:MULTISPECIES: tyrosine-type recombinase/integrase [unclassified Thioalkalivibrio]|uniref:tyrosine-type recombinase/integrase n=1 Tax=unclassified Thioalkalivibrio TaxID=2621013 RepID=UPI00037B57AE|nr:MULTISPECIES: tyrosine-type recombinase/integrase [unclassified Thioalkalivibrio]
MGAPVLIHVEDDLAAIQEFLAEYTDSPSTLRSYEKECVRLVVWAAEERGKSISDLTPEDIRCYEEFLKDPQPRSKWCGPKKPRVLADGSRNPEWRPFIGGLSPSSRRTALVVVAAMYAFLVDANYLAATPFAVRRSARRRGNKGSAAAHGKQERIFDDIQLSAIFEAIDEMPHSTVAQAKDRARLNLITLLMVDVAARIHEPALMAVGDCTRSRDGRWRIRIRGKGGREDLLPMSDRLLQAARDYLRCAGGPSLPSPGNSTPLVRGARKETGISSRRIHQLYTPVFARARDILRSKGEEDRANMMTEASPHWFRHTGITRFSDRARALNMPDKVVQKFGRHERYETTAQYIHKDIEDLESVVRTL